MNVDDKELARFVGKAIASRRVQADLTQEEVAEVLGIGNEAVSRMERGTVMPTVGRLVALAEIFRCGVGDLLRVASPTADDQGQRVSDLLSRLSVQDRTYALSALEQLCTHLQGRTRNT